MANIKRANASSITKSGAAIADVPDAPTGVSATGGDASASVTFTAATTGGTATSFTATSNPGSITGTSATSPITVSGLTNDTAYTFTVTASNSTGTSAASSASGSVTPVSPNSMYAIAMVEVGSAGASSITFSSIPSTYTHLQVRGIARSNRSSATQDWYELTFNSTSTGYSAHDLGGDGSSAFANATTNASYIELSKCATSTSGTNVFSAIVIDILDYGNTNKYKTVRSLGGLDMNGSGTVALDSGNWRDTSAISTLTIDAGNGTGFLQYTQFALYGIKG